jgi:hypothetical protein
VSPIEEMARECYGYGSWSAPYWFIGLEEGMDGLLQKRIDVWLELGRETGLSDCRAFHEGIGFTKWHQKKPKAALQSTWRPLMLLLMTFLERPADKESLREYHVNRWGMTDGETCVIELFGLPATDLQTGAVQRGDHFTLAQIEDIRQKRLECICGKMDEHKDTLKFVVMYGCKGRKSFEELAKRSLICDEVFKRGSTLMAFAPHPGEHGRKNDDWSTLGKKLREMKDPPIRVGASRWIS